MINQTLKNQKGEIKFRRKLVRQQIKGENIFDDEFDSENINEILKKRMNDTLKQIGFVKGKHIISPYIEIGAERCQRSLVMENDLKANGAAIDISYDMLKSCSYYNKVFKKRNLPLRICCDANNLPFMSNSVPFIFCYQTLHHFSDPSKVINEIHRVLSPGGCFYFDEEPYKKVLHLGLYKSKKIYSKESVNANLIKKILNYFFAEKTCNELDYGIIENDDISLKKWKKSLSLFGDKEVSLRSMRYIKSKLYGLRNPLMFALAYLFGGNISGSVYKLGDNKSYKKYIKDCIVCPGCLKKDNEYKVIKKNSFYFCKECGAKYLIEDDIIFLFTKKSFSKLYPKQYKYLNNKRFS